MLLQISRFPKTAGQGLPKKKKKKQPKIKQVVGSGKMHIQAITLKWNVHEAQQTTRGSRNNKKKNCGSINTHQGSLQKS